VVAFSPQAPPLPEINDGQQKPVVQLFPQAQDEIKMTNRRLHRLFRHRRHALGHAQADVVGDQQLRSQSRFQVFKALQKLPKWRPAESDIRPYRKMRQQMSGILLRGIELRDQVLMSSKTGNPALDLTR